jgi:hypothetical protein
LEEWCVYFCKREDFYFYLTQLPNMHYDLIVTALLFFLIPHDLMWSSHVMKMHDLDILAIWRCEDRNKFSFYIIRDITITKYAYGVRFEVLGNIQGRHIAWQSSASAIQICFLIWGTNKDYFGVWSCVAVS